MRDMTPLTEKEQMAVANAGFYFYDLPSSGQSFQHARPLFDIINRLIGAPEPDSSRGARGILVDTSALDAIESVVENVDVENAIVDALHAAGYRIMRVGGQPEYWKDRSYHCRSCGQMYAHDEAHTCGSS